MKDLGYNIVDFGNNSYLRKGHFSFAPVSRTLMDRVGSVSLELVSMCVLLNRSLNPLDKDKIFSHFSIKIFQFMEK